MMRGVENGMVVLQSPDEENGQWEPLARKVQGALYGKLTVRLARKRLEKRKLEAVIVGGTPAQQKRVANNLCLILVWPARKRPPAPAVGDQNLRGLLRRMKLPLDGWLVVPLT
jgi:hypothetical protein